MFSYEEAQLILDTIPVVNDAINVIKLIKIAINFHLHAVYYYMVRPLKNVDKSVILSYK